MVRNIVGALFEIGSKKGPVQWMKELLEGKNRNVKYKTILKRIM